MAESIENYRCPKCGYRSCETGEMHVTGGTLSKLFDVQNRKLTTVTCAQCKYTELYATDSSNLANVFDFFTQ